MWKFYLKSQIDNYLYFWKKLKGRWLKKKTFWKSLIKSINLGGKMKVILLFFPSENGTTKRGRTENKERKTKRKEENSYLWGSESMEEYEKATTVMCTVIGMDYANSLSYRACSLCERTLPDTLNALCKFCHNNTASSSSKRLFRVLVSFYYPTI